MSSILKGLGALLSEAGRHIGTNPIESDTKIHVDKTITAVTDLVKHLAKKG